MGVFLEEKVISVSVYVFDGSLGEGSSHLQRKYLRVFAKGKTTKTVATAKTKKDLRVFAKGKTIAEGKTDAKAKTIAKAKTKGQEKRLVRICKGQDKDLRGPRQRLACFCIGQDKRLACFC